MSTTDIIELAVPAKLPARGSSEPFAEEAQWILREHEINVYDAVVIVKRSAGIGEALVQIKDALAHGEWTPWTKRNLPGLSASTILRYMQIFRRKEEALAQEDPAAFLAKIYGNLELPPPEEGKNDASAPPDSKSVVNDGFENREEPPPPEKRTPKSRKTKTPPPAKTPSGSDASTVPSQSAGAISLEGHIGLSADALSKAMAGWKRDSFASLKEAARGNERLAGGLERLERNLDRAVKTLRGYRSIAS